MFKNVEDMEVFIFYGILFILRIVNLKSSLYRRRIFEEAENFRKALSQKLKKTVTITVFRHFLKIFFVYTKTLKNLKKVPKNSDGYSLFYFV